MAETLTMPPLKKAVWSCSSDDDGTLDDLLAEVASVGSLAGVAYTTAGARAITSPTTAASKPPMVRLRKGPSTR